MTSAANIRDSKNNDHNCGKDLLYLPKHSTSLNQETAASPMPSVITTERPILKSQGGPESGVSTDPLTNETGNRLLAT